MCVFLRRHRPREGARSAVWLVSIVVRNRRHARTETVIHRADENFAASVADRLRKYRLLGGRAVGIVSSIEDWPRVNGLWAAGQSHDVLGRTARH